MADTETLELDGGTTATVMYFDAQGRPCDKAVARRAEIEERDASGAVVMRTYAEIPGP